MEMQKIVGDNVRGYRKKINWTQEKLAVRAKVTPQHISRLELGQENVKLSTLVALVKELNIELYKLFIKESYNLD